MRKIIFTPLFVFGIFLLANSEKSYSQSTGNHLDVISEHRHQQPQTQRKPIFRLLGNSVVSKYNPVSLTLSGMLYVYQRSISNTLSNRCIYHPSCSNFSAQAINEKGFVLGVLLTTDRISRCNQIAAWDLPPHRMDENRMRFRDEINRYSSD